MKVSDVIIIGAGPAGIACALQLMRYGIRPLIFEKDAIGGLIRNANFVENYPGFSKGISGTELAEIFHRQCNNKELRISKERIVELDYVDPCFYVKTDKRTIQSRQAVIASGTHPVEFENVSRQAKDSIHYDIAVLRRVSKRKIVIIGSGDISFDYALTLSKKNEVTILVRKREAKCISVLYKRAVSAENIAVMRNIEVRRIEREGRKVLLKCKQLAEEKVILADRVLIAVGRRPNTDFLNKNISRKMNELKLSGRLFLIGDVANGMYRQVGISVGDGIRAAMQIYQKGLERS